MAKAGDLLCFLSVAAVTWLGCVVGLVTWTGLFPVEAAWLTVLVPLVPAVWLGLSVARWRPSGGRVQVALFSIVLGMAAPASLAIFVNGGPVDYETSLLLHPETGWLLPGAAGPSGQVGEALAWIGDDSEIPGRALVADGRSLARVDHPALFEYFGTAYGGDDDSFNLPDYRGMYVGSSPMGLVNPSVFLASREGDPRVEPVEMWTEIRWLIDRGE